MPGEPKVPKSIHYSVRMSLFTFSCTGEVENLPGRSPSCEVPKERPSVKTFTWEELAKLNDRHNGHVAIRNKVDYGLYYRRFRVFCPDNNWLLKHTRDVYTAHT